MLLERQTSRRIQNMPFGISDRTRRGINNACGLESAMSAWKRGEAQSPTSKTGQLFSVILMWLVEDNYYLGFTVDTDGKPKKHNDDGIIIWN